MFVHQSNFSFTILFNYDSRSMDNFCSPAKFSSQSLSENMIASLKATSSFNAMESQFQPTSIRQACPARSLFGHLRKALASAREGSRQKGPRP
jgi:hypothetical protein